MRHCHATGLKVALEVADDFVPGRPPWRPFGVAYRALRKTNMRGQRGGM
jgi:hypothetical protein